VYAGKVYIFKQTFGEMDYTSFGGEKVVGTRTTEKDE
jgi:hypothetical protein